MKEHPTREQIFAEVREAAKRQEEEKKAPKGGIRPALGITITITAVAAMVIGAMAASQIQQREKNVADTKRFLKVKAQPNRDKKRQSSPFIIRKTNDTPGQETSIDLDNLDEDFFRKYIRAVVPYMEDGRIFLEVQIDPSLDQPRSCENRPDNPRGCLESEDGIDSIVVEVPEKFHKWLRTLQAACPEGICQDDIDKACRIWAEETSDPETITEKCQSWLPEVLLEISQEYCPSQGCTPEEMQKALEDYIIREAVKKMAIKEGFEWSKVTQ